MEKTIFEKIADKEIPSCIIYEDELTIAFLDAFPKTIGHTLVIPKVCYKDIHEIPLAVLEKVMASVKHVASMLQSSLNPEGINIIQSNGEAAEQSVFHIHFHILPRYSSDTFKIWPNETLSVDLSEIQKKILQLN